MGVFVICVCSHTFIHAPKHLLLNLHILGVIQSKLCQERFPQASQTLDPLVIAASTMEFISIKAMHAIPRSEFNVEDALLKLCSY